MENSGKLQAKGIFLRDYCIALYKSGATTIRIEKNINRIANAWDCKADFSILPTCVVLTLWNKDNTESYNIIGKVPSEIINFSQVSALSSLSWNINDNHIDVDQAREEYNKITSAKSLNSWIVVLLVGLANGSFCELFGGDIAAITIVFIATVLGFSLKQRLPSMGVDYRFAIILASSISSIISCSGYVYGLTSTPEIALATSILYLVPGVPFSNAISDLIYGHYVCSLSRFLHAVIITVSLSLGLCLSFFILNIKFM